jgi:CRISPR-associated exonuclease Cas4
VWFLVGIALLILIVGIVLLQRGRRLRATTGLPAGEIVYTDTGAWEVVEQPLLSRRYGLVGKPDYLVRVRTGRHEMLIPVEVKSGRQPRRPAANHILQLATYCLLVEDVHKQQPAYGLIHYADATIQIAYTQELRRAVLDAAEAIRRARRAPQVARSHQEPGRCHGCGYRHGCGAEAL